MTTENTTTDHQGSESPQTPEPVGVVYRLVGGPSETLHSSLEGAKAHADRVLEQFRTEVAAADPDPALGAYTFVDELVWEDRPRPRAAQAFGPRLYPTARLSPDEDDELFIETIDLLP